jgi:hypothetical protein
MSLTTAEKRHAVSLLTRVGYDCVGRIREQLFALATKLEADEPESTGVREDWIDWIAAAKRDLAEVVLWAPGYDWNTDPRKLTLKTGGLFATLDKLAAKLEADEPAAWMTLADTMELQMVRTKVPSDFPGTPAEFIVHLQDFIFDSERAALPPREDGCREALAELVAAYDDPTDGRWAGAISVARAFLARSQEHVGAVNTPLRAQSTADLSRSKK